jgi:hypothetical protein
MIVITDHFISDDDCDYLISLYEKNQDLIFQYRNTYPIALFNLNDSRANLTIEQIKIYAEHLSNQSLVVSNAEIVKWPVGSYMDKHIDPSTDVFAGLVYLNDDYDGGYTSFIGKEIQPKKGSFVIFHNSILEHWVTEIEKNERFTLAVWLI